MEDGTKAREESDEPPVRDRSVTSRDVARLAGVSQATVSRVLNDTVNVSRPLRERVLRALDQTGYRPNAAAKAMKTGRTGTIGVVIARITNPFYPELLDTIGRELAAADHRMILWETEFAGEESAIDAIRRGLVDGLLFTTAMPGQPAVAEALRRDAPMVLVNRTLPGSPCDQVSSDNAAGAALIGRHLVAAGHQRIGFIGGRPGASTADERDRGLRRAIGEHGLDAHLQVTTGDFSHEAGRSGLTELLERAEPPTAVVGVNDLTAIGAINEALARGLKVGSDVAIAGFDDIRMASWASFDLTTVRQPSADMAHIAVRRLLARVGGERGDFVHERFDCELIERSSA